MISFDVHFHARLSPPPIWLVPLPVCIIHISLITPGEIRGALHVPESNPHGVIMLELVFCRHGHQEGLLDAGVHGGELSIVHPGDGQGPAGGTRVVPVSFVNIEQSKQFVAPALKLQPVLGTVAAWEGCGGLGGPGPVSGLLADKPVPVTTLLVIPLATRGVDAGAALRALGISGRSPQWSCQTTRDRPRCSDG